MYYEERAINGQLHYKNHNSQWTPFTTHMLNKRIVELEEKLAAPVLMISMCDGKIVHHEFENYEGVTCGINKVFERLSKPKDGAY